MTALHPAREDEIKQVYEVFYQTDFVLSISIHSFRRPPSLMHDAIFHQAKISFRHETDTSFCKSNAFGGAAYSFTM